jgi:hypothetical protein
MAIFIVAYQQRTSRESITFKDASGGTATLAANDKVRIKIGRSGQTPLLDVVSGSNLSGGSYVTKANPAILELVGGDLAPSIIQPGSYDIEACVVDSADSSRIKLAEQGVFTLIGTQGGGTS